MGISNHSIEQSDIIVGKSGRCWSVDYFSDNGSLTNTKLDRVNEFEEKTFNVEDLTLRTARDRSRNNPAVWVEE